MLDLLADLEARIASDPLSTKADHEAFRIRYLGRKSGVLTDLFKRLPELPPAERPAFGQHLNRLRQQAEARLAEAEARLSEAEARGPLLDLTLPGSPIPHGSLHPLTKTLRDVQRIFERLGFAVERGPEAETDWHNFSALGFPDDHPARDMQDTFFLKEDKSVLLRTHTSPVQIRAMQTKGVPLRIIAPGRVYRNESISYKSFCLFHQVEGLYVDKNVTFADLKAILHLFADAFFGEGTKMRFRPSFFPFTEPSAEVDIWWANPDLTGGGRWLEILGCGMVDPVVLAQVGVDPEQYSGYAFGMGVERMAMLRHGIDDIRLLYENDARLLAQF